MKGFYFDKEGAIQMNTGKDNIPVIMGGMITFKEEDIEEIEDISQDRIRMINEYSKKYPSFTIEQIAELIDSPDLNLGESYVIRKIIENER